MKATLPLILCASVTLMGCERISSSRLNPLNWFGEAQSTAPIDPTTGTIAPLTPSGGNVVEIDARTLVGTVTALTIERTPDGAIVRATGATTAAGQFNAELVPISTDGRTLSLAFRVETPATAAVAGQPRQITAAYLIGNEALSAIRTIRVQGTSNALTRSR